MSFQQGIPSSLYEGIPHLSSQLSVFTLYPIPVSAPGSQLPGLTDVARPQCVGTGGQTGCPSPPHPALRRSGWQFRCERGGWLNTCRATCPGRWAPGRWAPALGCGAHQRAPRGLGRVGAEKGFVWPSPSGGCVPYT